MLNDVELGALVDLQKKVDCLEAEVARLDRAERALRRHLGLESCDMCGEWFPAGELREGQCHVCDAITWWQCHPRASVADRDQAAGLVDDVRAVIDEADEVDRRRRAAREAQAGGS